MSYHPHKTWPGYWTIDYRVIDHVQKGGKTVKTVQRIREHIEVETAEEAADYERRVRGIHVSQCRTHVSPPFKEIAAEFKTWAETNRSATYQKHIGWMLKELLPVFGIFPPSRITDAMVEKFKADHKEKSSMCNHQLKMLTIIINWGANPKRAYCKPLPFKVELLQHKKALMRVPSHDNFELFISEVKDPRKKALCMIMYWSGARFNDIVKAKWEDIDWQNATVISRVKRGAEKVILLPEDAIAILDNYRLGKYTRKKGEPFKKITEGWIFENKRTGLPWTHIKKSFKAAWEHAGIQKIKGPHTLRHACGKNTLDTTGDLRLTQEMLGHSQISQTQIYTTVAVDRLIAAQKRTRARLVLVDKKDASQTQQNSTSTG